MLKNKFLTFKIYILILVSLFSIIYGQLDFGINYEMKYSDGEIDATDIFENYFDINIYYNDLYVYSLLRYKNPALIGLPTENLDDMYNIFYVEYLNKNLELQIGDIFQSYGSGLSFYTYEDRIIDYNNAPRGINILYYFKDNMDLFATIGKNTFSARTKPSITEPNIFLDNELILAGFSYQSDYFDMHYLSAMNNQNIDSKTIVNMMTLDNELKYYLEDRYQYIEPQDYSMKIMEHNLGSTFYLDAIEFYFEKSWVYHNKIGGERTFGYKYYFSSYLSLNDYGILYEYKNYNTPLYYSVYSNPPIVFKENPSTLISRNLHNVDFSNEVGHHITINKSYSEQVNMIVNAAFSFNHLFDDNIPEPGFGKILNSFISLENISEFEQFNPYRQLYIELNGWSKNEKLFYKVGVDNYFEYASGKIIKSKTLPSQFTLKLNQGNSISAYLEFQKTFYYHTPAVETHRFIYFSPSYNHFGKWIVSLFGDFESEINSSSIAEEHLGVDVTYYISGNNIISFFLGSQKGGLVCANGTCVLQPDFKNGFKVTSRLMF